MTLCVTVIFNFDSQNFHSRIINLKAITTMYKKIPSFIIAITVLVSACNSNTAPALRSTLKQ